MSSAADRSVELRRLAPVAAALLILSGCATVTPIGTLLSDPGRFDGKTVTIRGNVVESAGGLGLGAYQVKDPTGQLTVVTETVGPPRQGAKIRVKGTFQAIFTLSSKGLSVLREQSRQGD